MIIWSGWGFLVFVIVFAVSLLAELSVESSLHDESYYQSHRWPLAAALVCSAVVTWYLGSFLSGRPGRTGRDRFFFIPVQHWAPILAVLAIASLAFR